MYPLKFQPIFQKRLWGGQRLRTILGKPVPGELQRQPVGESWELADLPAGTVQADSAGANADGSLATRIINGPFAGRNLHDAWSAQNSALSTQPSALHFPLLIKFLDAQQDLSVQVHPDAAYAAAHSGAHLKSEAWYILHAEPGAKIYKGLKPGTTREQFENALEAGTAAELLNAVTVHPGDCHYLESGTVHALGAGILAAEVQTPSDTTFRVFDWNRLGADGKPRALHIKEAMECIRFDEPELVSRVEGAAQPWAQGDRLIACEHFLIDRVKIPLGQTHVAPDRLCVWIVLAGQGVITAQGGEHVAFARGDTLLLPAGMKEPRVRTIADCSLLNISIPSGVI